MFIFVQRSVYFYLRYLYAFPIHKCLSNVAFMFICLHFFNLSYFMFFSFFLFLLLIFSVVFFSSPSFPLGLFVYFSFFFINGFRLVDLTFFLESAKNLNSQSLLCGEQGFWPSFKKLLLMVYKWFYFSFNRSFPSLTTGVFHGRSPWVV